jgi:hypothetical protein
MDLSWVFFRKHMCLSAVADGSGIRYTLRSIVVQDGQETIDSFWDFRDWKRELGKVDALVDGHSCVVAAEYRSISPDIRALQLRMGETILPQHLVPESNTAGTTVRLVFDIGAFLPPIPRTFNPNRGTLGERQIHTYVCNDWCDQLAVHLGHPNVDMNAVNIHGSTALMLAISLGRFECILLLLDRGASPFGPDGRNIMHCAATARIATKDVTRIIHMLCNRGWSSLTLDSDDKGHRPTNVVSQVSRHHVKAVKAAIRATERTVRSTIHAHLTGHCPVWVLVELIIAYL